MTRARARDIALGIVECLPYLPIMLPWLAVMAFEIVKDIAYHKGWLKV